eukprot:g1820.t1
MDILEMPPGGSGIHGDLMNSNDQRSAEMSELERLAKAHNLYYSAEDENTSAEESMFGANMEPSRGKKKSYYTHYGLNISWTTRTHREKMMRSYYNAIHNSKSYVGQEVRKHQMQMVRNKELFSSGKNVQRDKEFRQKKIDLDNQIMEYRMKNLPKSDLAKINDSGSLEKRLYHDRKKARKKARINSKRFHYRMLNYENSLILERIKKSKSAYDHRNWENDFKRHEKIKKHMARIEHKSMKPMDYTVNESKTMHEKKGDELPLLYRPEKKLGGGSGTMGISRSLPAIEKAYLGRHHPAEKLKAYEATTSYHQQQQQHLSSMLPAGTTSTGSMRSLYRNPKNYNKPSPFTKTVGGQPNQRFRKRAKKKKKRKGAGKNSSKNNARDRGQIMERGITIDGVYNVVSVFAEGSNPKKGEDGNLIFEAFEPFTKSLRIAKFSIKNLLRLAEIYPNILLPGERIKMLIGMLRFDYVSTVCPFNMVYHLCFDFF